MQAVVQLPCSVWAEVLERSRFALLCREMQASRDVGLDL